MLPEGFVLNRIKEYNKRLIYWALLMPFLSIYPFIRQMGQAAGRHDWDVFVLSVFMMVALINITKFLIRSSRPVLHPLIKTLKKNGDVEEIIAEIDKEALEDGIDDRQTIIVTASWIIYRGFFTLKAIPLSRVAWFYLKPSGRKKPGRRKLAVFSIESKLRLLGFNEKSQKSNQVISEISRNAPWSYSGYSRKIAGLWRDNRQKMLDSVQKKQKRKTSASHAQ